MARIFFLLLIALVCAPAALAQDYSRYEFYVGYAYERANNAADQFDRNATATVNGARVDFVSQREGYNGFEVEFNQNVTAHVGLVASFSGTYNRTDFVDRVSGRTFSARESRYSLLAGPRYNWRTSSVTPFAHALFGISNIRAKFDNPTCTAPRSRTGFAMAFGGGLDVHASERIDVRAIQVDYLPTFFDGKRQDNIRASAGIKIK
jgi:opacity protein-like surface antigen